LSISIEESIQRFKTEILAQDWRMPARRIPPLVEAAETLGKRFSTRKHLKAILTMITSVLSYLEKHQEQADDIFVDFLKEAMAHVVNVYEDGRFDPEQEEVLFRKMYGKFNVLKERVKKTSPAAVKPVPADNQAPPEKKSSEPPETAGTSSPASKRPPSAPTGAVETFSPLPGTPFRVVTVGHFPLAFCADNVALMEQLHPKKRKAYLATSQVPLKDFRRTFRRLSARFQGPLREIPSSRLKKLVLPLVTPRGMGLPSLPDEEADTLVIISHNQWHGVVLCREPDPELRILARFQEGKNGDIAGLAYLDDETQVPMLNHRTLLKREGFLAAVDPDFLGKV